MIIFSIVTVYVVLFILLYLILQKYARQIGWKDTLSLFKEVVLSTLIGTAGIILIYTIILHFLGIL